MRCPFSFWLQNLMDSSYTVLDVQNIAGRSNLDDEITEIFGQQQKGAN